jgi:hypothetical protein
MTSLAAEIRYLPTMGPVPPRTGPTYDQPDPVGVSEVVMTIWPKGTVGLQMTLAQG